MVKKLFSLEQVTEMVTEPVHSILSVMKGWTRAWLMVSRLEGSIIKHFSKKSFSWLTFFKCFSSLNFWLPRRAESSSRLCDKLVMTVIFSCEGKVLYLCTVQGCDAIQASTGAICVWCCVINTLQNKSHTNTNRYTSMTTFMVTFTYVHNT